MLMDTLKVRIFAISLSQADTVPANVKFGFDVLDVSECCCLMDERRCRIDEERVGIPANNGASWQSFSS